MCMWCVNVCGMCLVYVLRVCVWGGTGVMVVCECVVCRVFVGCVCACGVCVCDSVSLRV